MAKHDRRVYAPAPEAQPGRRPPRDDDDDGPSGRPLLYALIGISLIALGAFLWQSFSGGPAPRVVVDGPFKSLPTAQPPTDPTEQVPSTAGAVPRPRPGPEEPLSPEALAQSPGAAAKAGPVTAGPSAVPAAGSEALRIAGSGPFVAQIAAVADEVQAQEEWQRLARRAPALFNRARLDVKRADLGQLGVRYRIRAGYFANRADAQAFCEHLRGMALDCLAAPR